ncbi:phosphatidylinositol-glycan biosynthesis class S protein-domain-containing protein [Flagelloscypha sp. PMI_526]|nr:phosphatidylinositol-glycan biosynthesis class S protein-domain-containing protein [Flagelloscypha sp. PMI_526]
MSNSETQLRDPNTLFYQRSSIRRSIVTSYWVIIILAVPLWWHLTSITRLGLPASRVAAEQTRRLQIPVELHMDLEEGVIDSVVEEWNRMTSNDPSRWNGLGVTFKRSSELETGPNTYRVYHSDGSEELGDRTLGVPLRERSAARIVELLSSLLAAPPVSQARQRRAAVYAPRYRLAFSLLNEDPSHGKFVNSWEIRSAIAAHITPILSATSGLHNFTIESQVQLHSRLEFEPEHLEDGSFGLTPEHLTVFVNSAEWSLASSVSNDPVLHFLVFIPSPARSPVQILDDSGSITSSKAFLLPQWGGIYIYNLPPSFSSTTLDENDLSPVFNAFSRQLRTLLGVNPLPSRSEIYHLPEVAATPIAGWQLDELMRRRTIENTRESQDTLSSIVQLVDKIENMPVGKDVLEDVEESLLSLERLLDNPAQLLQDALRLSAKSLTLSSRAFFNPGMIGLLYFPAEHKYAVYTPLFASAVIPLLAASVREFKAWRSG